MMCYQQWGQLFSPLPQDWSTAMGPLQPDQSTATRPVCCHNARLLPQDRSTATRLRGLHATVHYPQTIHCLKNSLLPHQSSTTRVKTSPLLSEIQTCNNLAHPSCIVASHLRGFRPMVLLQTTNAHFGIKGLWEWQGNDTIGMALLEWHCWNGTVEHCRSARWAIGMDACTWIVLLAFVRPMTSVM